MHMSEFTYNLILITEFSYSIILITEFFISPVGVQNRNLVHGVPVGTIQNIVELITYAFLLFIIHILII